MATVTYKTDPGTGGGATTTPTAPVMTGTYQPGWQGTPLPTPPANPAWNVPQTHFERWNVATGQFERLPWAVTPDTPTEMLPWNFRAPQGYNPTYWENPQNVSRWYDAISSAPTGWTPPPGIDPDAINNAYEYLKIANGNSPWWQWQYLPSDDPGREYLKGMAQPSQELLRPSERGWATGLEKAQIESGAYAQSPLMGMTPAQQEAYATAAGQNAAAQAEALPGIKERLSENKFTSEGLYPWQKFNLMFTSPRNPDQPWYSLENLTKIGYNVGMSTLTAAGLASMTGIPGAGIVAGGVALAGGLYKEATYQPGVEPAYVPVLDEFTAAIKGSGQFIRDSVNVIGQVYRPELLQAMAEQITTPGDFAQKVGELLKQLSSPEYGTMWNILGSEFVPSMVKQDNKLLNQFYQAAQAGYYVTTPSEGALSGISTPMEAEVSIYNLLQPLVPGWQPSPHAKPGETWAYEHGLANPVEIDAGLNGAVSGVLVLDEARRRIMSGEDPNAVLFDVQDRYHAAGLVNDMVMQMTIDPLNYLPLASSVLGKGVAKYILKKPALAQAFEMTYGNFFTDALPFGLQMFTDAALNTGITIARRAGNKGLADLLAKGMGSRGWIDALKIYKGMVRSGYAVPTRVRYAEVTPDEFDILTRTGVTVEKVSGPDEFATERPAAPEVVKPAEEAVKPVEAAPEAPRPVPAEQPAPRTDQQRLQETDAASADYSKAVRMPVETPEQLQARVDAIHAVTQRVNDDVLPALMTKNNQHRVAAGNDPVITTASRKTDYAAEEFMRRKVAQPAPAAKPAIETVQPTKVISLRESLRRIRENYARESYNKAYKTNKVKAGSRYIIGMSEKVIAFEEIPEVAAPAGFKPGDQFVLEVTKDGTIIVGDVIEDMAYRTKYGNDALRKIARSYENHWSISASGENALYDLGYSRIDIDNMVPPEAVEIIDRGIRKESLEAALDEPYNKPAEIETTQPAPTMTSVEPQEVIDARAILSRPAPVSKDQMAQAAWGLERAKARKIVDDFEAKQKVAQPAIEAPKPAEAPKKMWVRIEEKIPLTELDAVDRFLGGITKEGTYKEMGNKPMNSKGLVRLFSYLGTMNPESKATAFVNIILDNVRNIMGQMKTPEEVARILKTWAGGNNPDYATLASYLAAFLHSPEAYTVQPAFRAWTQQFMDGFEGEWIELATNRAYLEMFARVLGETPSKVIEDLIAKKGDVTELYRRLADAINTHPDKVSKLSDDLKAGRLTQEEVDKLLRPFSKENKPYLASQWKTDVVKSMDDFMGKWTVNYFGVKPDKLLFRFGAMMKTVMSQLVLNINPLYAINNILNNWVTTAAEGSFGLSTNAEAMRWFNRFGAVPARLREGFGAGGEGGDVSGMIQAIRNAATQRGILTDIQRFASKGNKLPLASKLSQWAEQQESASATFHAMQLMWGKMWKPGIGYRKLPTELLRGLMNIDPGLPDMIYMLINNSMNKEELLANFSTGIRKRNIYEYIQKTADEMGSSLENTEDLLTQSGILDFLNRNMKDTDTPQQIESLCNAAEVIANEQIDLVHGLNLEGRAFEAAQNAQAYGYQYVVRELAGATLKIFKRHVEQYAEWDEIFLKTQGMEKGAKGRYIADEYRRSEQAWSRVWSEYLATMKGLVNGLGEGADADNVVRLINTIQTTWSRFYNGYDENGTHVLGKRELLAQFYDRSSSFKNQAEREMAHAEMQNNISGLFAKAISEEIANTEAVYRIFTEQMRTVHGAEYAKLAEDWGKRVIAIRKQMATEINDHYRTTADMTATERYQAWNAFIKDRYDPMIAALAKEQIDSSVAIANKFAEAAKVKPMETPAVPKPEEVVAETPKVMPEVPAAEPAIPPEEMPVTPTVRGPAEPGTVVPAKRLATLTIAEQDALKKVMADNYWVTGTVKDMPVSRLFNSVNKDITGMNSKGEAVSTPLGRVNDPTNRQPYANPGDIELADAERAITNRREENLNKFNKAAADERNKAIRIAEVRSQSIYSRRHMLNQLTASNVDGKPRFTQEQIAGYMAYMDGHAALWASTPWADGSTHTVDEWWASCWKMIGDLTDDEIASLDTGAIPPGWTQQVRVNTNDVAFKDWFKESKAVDENGKPLELYHGTLSTFDVFVSGSPESYWGSAFYFTNKTEDANLYASINGPDWSNKLATAIDNLDNVDDWSPFVDDIADILNIDTDTVWGWIDGNTIEKHVTEEVKTALAKKQLGVQHEGAVMKVYLSLQKPLDLTKNATERLEYNFVEDAQGNIIREEGTAVEFIDAIRQAVDDLGQDESVANLILSKDILIEDLDGMKIVDAFDKLRRSETVSNMDGEFGGDYVLIGNEFLKAVAQNMGYDGVIMDAWESFGPKKFAWGAAQPMKGVTPGTLHYVAFNNRQIKSVWNKGTYDPLNPNIMMQRTRLDESTRAFKEWFRESAASEFGGSPMVLYHGTNADFTEFRPSTNAWRLETKLGPHFAESPEVASRFAMGLYRRRSPTGEYNLEGGNVLPVYLSVQHPRIIEPSDRAFDENLIRNDMVNVVMTDNREMFMDWFEQRWNKIYPRELGGQIYDALHEGRPVDETVIGSPKIELRSSETVLPGEEKLSDVARYIVHQGLGAEFTTQNGDVLVNEYKRILKSQGYDGLVYENTSPMETQGIKMYFPSDSIYSKNSVELPDVQNKRTWIPFDNWQVKSIFNRNPTMSPDIMLQVQRTGWYYDALDRHIQAMPQNKMSAKQLLGWLGGKAKAEEMRDTGMENWLRSKGDQVLTKDEVQEYLDINRVTVEETVLSDDFIIPLNWTASGAFQYVSDGGEYTITRLQTGMYRLDNQASRASAFETLDEAKRNADKWNRGTIKAPPKYAFGNLITPGGTGQTELLLTVPVKGNAFVGGHYSESNIVVHLRFNTRTDARGRKILFIEEIQSDWHQKARDLAEARATSEGLAKGTPEFTKRVGWYIEDYNRLGEPGIPPGPFAKSYESLAMKRALYWAAENGYDGIGWTTGLMQVQRYKAQLRQTVDRLELGQDLSGYKNGQRVFQENVPDERLADYVGKDIAQDLIAKRGESNTGVGVVEGDNLTIGGEGMKAAYDKRLVTIANDLLNKYGGRVEETNIGNGDIVQYEIYDYTGIIPETDLMPNGLIEVWAQNDLIKRFKTREEAEFFINNLKKQRVKNVPFYSISDAMRQDVIKGLPLYQKNGNLEAMGLHYTDPVTLQSVIKFSRTGNFTTLIHETGHAFLADLYKTGIETGNKQVLADFELLRTIVGNLRNNDPEQFRRIGILEAGEERWNAMSPDEQDALVRSGYFARQFEEYMASGKAPIVGLMRIFEKFKIWLKGIFKTFAETGYKLKLDERMVGIFDRMVATDKETIPLSIRFPKERTQGKVTRAYSPADKVNPYSFVYKIVDASELNVSHDNALNKSLFYPADELQLCDCERVASEMEVNKIYNSFNPELMLTPSLSIIDGAPIVREDNVVLSGNGRMVAINRLIQDHSPKWNDYQAMLRNNLDEYGLQPVDLEGIDNPVLVRVWREDPAADPIKAAQKFVKEANGRESLGFSPAEQGHADANQVSTDVLNLLTLTSDDIDDVLANSNNSDFVGSFVAKYPTNEQADLLDASGKISQAGIARIQNALFMRVFGEERGRKLFEMFREETDPDIIEPIKQGVLKGIGALAKLEGMVELGMFPREYSLADDLIRAVDVMIAAKKKGISADEYMQIATTPDMFGQAALELTPFQQAFVTWLSKNKVRSAVIRRTLTAYVNELTTRGSERSDSMFGRRTPGEVLDVAYKSVTGEDGGFAKVEKVVPATEVVKPAPEVVVVPEELAKPVEKPIHEYPKGTPVTTPDGDGVLNTTALEKSWVYFADTQRIKEYDNALVKVKEPEAVAKPPEAPAPKIKATPGVIDLPKTFEPRFVDQTVDFIYLRRKYNQTMKDQGVVFVPLPMKNRNIFNWIKATLGVEDEVAARVLQEANAALTTSYRDITGNGDYYWTAERPEPDPNAYPDLIKYMVAPSTPKPELDLNSFLDQEVDDVTPEGRPAPTGAERRTVGQGLPEAAGARPAGGGVVGKPTVPTAVKGGEPTRIGVRTDSGFELYESGDRPAITRKPSDAVASKLREEQGQVTDLSRILTAFDHGKRSYLLANGTGTGKSFVALGLIKETNAKRVLIVVPNETLIIQYQDYARLAFPDVQVRQLSSATLGNINQDGVQVITYTLLADLYRDDPAARASIRNGKWDLLVVDESHNMKNYSSWKPEVQRATAVLDVMNSNMKAKTLFMSATPFQSLVEAQYLSSLGLWSNYSDFLSSHGYTWVEPKYKNAQGYWQFEGNPDDLIRFHKEMVKAGVYSQRELKVDVNLDNIFVRVKMPDRWQSLYNRIESGFADLDWAYRTPMEKATAMAMRVLMLRRVMEYAKSEEAIAMAKKLNNAGRQVAIFLAYRNKPNASNIRNENVRNFINTMWDEINAQGDASIQRVVSGLGNSDTVAQVHGGITSDKKVAQEIADYQSGKKKFLVATLAKGGTGVSLHDTVGNAPRAQINVMLPWSGQEFQQVNGRSYRSGSKSDVIQVWMFADTPKERGISTIVGGRLLEMGALVEGIPAKADAAAIAAFDHDMLEDVNTALRLQGNQPMYQAKKKAEQMDLFASTGSVEDLPLFSGTPERVNEEVFRPEEKPQQPTLFGTAPVIGNRVVVISLLGKGVNNKTLIRLGDVEAIRALQRRYPNAAMQYAITTEDGGTIIKKGEGWNDILPKEVPTGETLFQQQREPDAMGPILPDTLDQQLPMSEALEELWIENIRKVTKTLKKHAMADQGEMSGKMGKIPNDLYQKVMSYVNGVVNDMGTSKLATQQYGESKRDMALLNYNKRYGIDNILNLIFPYQFWYTRTMMNWALRSMQKPQWLAMYARLRDYQRKGGEKGEVALPTRLEGKVRIPAPWLPEGMGSTLYIDPYKVLFPFATIATPFEQYGKQESLVDRKVDQLLSEWAQDGTYTQAEVQQAFATHSGSVYEAAHTQSEAEMNGELSNPLDFVKLIMSPAMYLSLPLNALKIKVPMISEGSPENISTLPFTRLGQALRGATQGTPLEFLGNVLGMIAKPEEMIREKVGLSPYGTYGNYYIDRQISNMAADGLVSAEDALRAMVERTGPIYEQAKQRVEFEMTARTPPTMGVAAAARGASPEQIAFAFALGLMPASLFPDGELKQRGLKDSYDKAWQAKDAGNAQAVTQWFTEHPEYETRLLALKGVDGPEAQMRSFLINEIWDRYYKLPDLNRREATDQLGETFQTAFLNTDTRSYDSINVQTMASWAQALGAFTPTKLVSSTTQMKLKLTEPAMANLVQKYNDAKEKLFPKIGDISTLYYGLTPEQQAQSPWKTKVDAYNKWRNAYLAANPTIIPLIQSEQSELYGLPIDIQTVVYQFRAARDTQFPNLEKLQNEYFALKDGALSNVAYPQTDYQKKTKQPLHYMTAKSLYLQQHPELTKYWDWRTAYAAKFPRAAPWILSEQTLSGMISGETTGGGGGGGTSTYTPYSGGGGGGGYTEPPVLTNAEMKDFSPPLIRQLYAYFLSGRGLGEGAMAELQRLYKKSGRKIAFADWLDKIVRQSFSG